MPSGDAHLNPPDTSITARVHEDLAAGEAPVDLAKACLLAQRIISRGSREFDDEATYLARAVLRQNAILDEYEARLAERMRADR